MESKIIPARKFFSITLSLADYSTDVLLGLECHRVGGCDILGEITPAVTIKLEDCSIQLLRLFDEGLLHLQDHQGVDLL